MCTRRQSVVDTSMLIEMLGMASGCRAIMVAGESRPIISIRMPPPTRPAVEPRGLRLMASPRDTRSSPAIRATRPTPTCSGGPVLGLAPPDDPMVLVGVARDEPLSDRGNDAPYLAHALQS